MVFKCQEDSFLKEFSSKVLSCDPSEVDIVEGGKTSQVEGFAVVLENTILFPEGGGQPSDTGYLDDSRVHHVIRKGATAVHYVDKPLPIGKDVKQKIDWDRREDHMQQHSGQHLISAIFDKEYNWTTVSWWLGEEVSYIELDTPSVDAQCLKKVEQDANDYVKEGRSVNVILYNENSSPQELDHARSVKGLPLDHVGDIRVIDIDGIDKNMCCGTHVNNLYQLQAIKLLYSEKSKRKDKTFVYFLCGNRVFKKLNDCWDREQKLMVLLKSNPAQHVELVEKLQKNVKFLSKNLQSVLKDLAISEVTKLKSTNPAPKYFFLYRKEAELDFMNIFIKELGRQDILLCLSIGDEKKSGNIVLYGPEQHVQALGPKVCEILGGKGAGKGDKFQAKVTVMGNRPKAEKLIAEYFLKANSVS